MCDYHEKLAISKRNRYQVALLVSLSVCLGIAFLTLIQQPARAAMLCVNTDGSGGCYTSIQAAIDGAAAGDTIIIAAGVYSETDGASMTIPVSKPGLVLDGAGPETLISSTIQNNAINTTNTDVANRGNPYGILNYWDAQLTLNRIQISQPYTYGILNHGGILATQTTVNAPYGFYQQGSLSTSTFTNSTLSSIVGNGRAPSGPITVYHSAIISFTHCCGIYAANTIFLGPCLNYWTVHSLGHNIEKGNTCTLNGTGDMVNTNPQLTQPLLVNGVLVNALLPTSPAIEAAEDAYCPSTDQTGFARPFGVHCDIGPFEWRPNAYFLKIFRLIMR